MRRPVTLALHGALLAALVVGPLAYVAAEKTVAIDVDGSVTDVRTYASSVGALLSEQGLAVGSHDVVSPATTAPLADGTHVALLRARQVRLVIDGSSRWVWTTARTVDDLARDLGDRYQQAELSVSRYQRIPLAGLDIEVRMPKTVDVSYGGSRAVLVTYADTWQQALTEAGWGSALGSGTVLSVPLTSAVTDGQAVALTSIASQVVRRTLAIRYPTTRVADPAHYVGTSLLHRAGRNGVRTYTWRFTFRDGRRVGVTLLSSVVSQAPVPAVVLVGTRHRPVVTVRPVVHRTSVDNLNWAALAQCESGGNPRAVGGGGRYLGLYQFTLSTWHGVGGAGSPVDASATEQTYRAKLLYLRSGAGNWPYCGRLL